MNNRRLTIFLASLCLTTGTGLEANAQDYVTPPVVVSTDKVRFNGVVYYSHVVQERQTLYSISKAYNVTLEEIYKANPTLKLESEGLKKDQILLIPVKEQEKEVKETTAPASGRDRQDVEDDEYFIHRVKWFEDLGAIARKYSVSRESIMNINGMTSEKVRRKDEIKIPVHPQKWENPNITPRDGVTGSAETDKEDRRVDSRESSDGIPGRIVPKSRKTSAVLLLPFNTSKKTDTQMMDFYSGALLASKDLGDEGKEIELNVYDSAVPSMPVTDERFAASDFVIGPVSNADIARTVNACKGRTWIISPLDPRAEALADTIPNVIQTPPPTAAQIRDMVRWVDQDLKAEDKVMVVTQKGVTANGYSSAVLKEVRDYGLKHTDMTFNILEGRQIMGRIAALMTGSGVNRVIIASDSKAFVIEVVRLLYLLSNQKMDIVLYSTSKLKTYDEIDAEQLHSLNLHASVSYHVDYDSKEVQDFLMKYRAIYNTEPSRSAFQGYDVMRFFTTLNSEYGRKWSNSGDIEGSGLQSDFSLGRTSRGGFVNKAVRRIVYDSDYSIRLVR